MVAHCLREAPLECCGILCGIAPRVSLFYSLRNDMKSETRYNADPHELIAAHIDFRRQGAEILAIYHSHPRWQAVPSQTDLVETFRELYPTQLRYGGNRSILLDAAEEIPEPELRHCLALALTYHLRKRKTAD